MQNGSFYDEGETWTVRSLLAHFVMSEKTLFNLFARIQAGGAGVPENFSIDSYNAAHQEQTKEQSAQALLAQLKATRAGLIDWVATLSADDLEKIGRHPFFGVTTLSEMIKMIYRHNQIHMRDLRRVISEQ